MICSVNPIGRNRRTWKRNQITPTYLRSGYGIIALAIVQPLSIFTKQSWEFRQIPTSFVPCHVLLCTTTFFLVYFSYTTWGCQLRVPCTTKEWLTNSLPPHSQILTPVNQILFSLHTLLVGYKTCGISAVLLRCVCSLFYWTIGLLT